MIKVANICLQKNDQFDPKSEVRCGNEALRVPLIEPGEVAEYCLLTPSV